MLATVSAHPECLQMYFQAVDQRLAVVRETTTTTSSYHHHNLLRLQTNSPLTNASSPHTEVE
jgi:hypothetical protein